MSRYAPLHDHLAGCAEDEIELSFAEVEAIIGGRLPKSALRRQWWANESSHRSTHVQCHAWRRAGYVAVAAVAKAQVRFRRLPAPLAEHHEERSR